MVSSSSYTETSSTKLGLGISHPKSPHGIVRDNLIARYFGIWYLTFFTQYINSAYQNKINKLLLGNAHLVYLLQGRSDTSDSVIREMQQSSMSERRSVTENNQQKGRTVYKNIYV
jgi:hypothetical protein